MPTKLLSAIVTTPRKRCKRCACCIHCICLIWKTRYKTNADNVILCERGRCNRYNTHDWSFVGFNCTKMTNHNFREHF